MNIGRRREEQERIVKDWDWKDERRKGEGRRKRRIERKIGKKRR